MSIKIGLIGAPGAGKDTFADYLVKEHNFKKLSFADQIKTEFYKDSGITEEQFKNARGTPLEEEIRAGLWEYSDKMRKEYGNLHFIDPVIKKVSNNETNVVVTDIRTKDEMTAMGKEAGLALIIRDLKLVHPLSKFPGTRLNFSDLLGIPVLWNYSADLEAANSTFCEFYYYLIHTF